LRGLEPVSKHSDTVSEGAGFRLDAHSIARPGVFSAWAASLWPETGARWARLSLSSIKEGVRVRAKSPDEANIR
jgi:hypothetical protein